MSLIHDTITAPNVAGYYNASKLDVDTTLGDKIFPSRKQLGLKLAFVKGASGRPVILKPSAFDTKVTLRERMTVDLTETEMPFFKEGILVKESDRQQLNIIAQTGNQTLIDTVINGIFDDSKMLISGARARLEAMRMQVLATGKIAIKSNGVALDFDYGVASDYKGVVAKSWSDAANATPIADIEKAISSLEALGGKAEVIYMNSATFALAKNAASTVTMIKPLAPKGAGVTRSEFTMYIQDNFNLSIVVKNETYKDGDGNVIKYFPDGTVTFAPNVSLGNTVFGTTPEESDLFGGNVGGVEVEIVDSGIAVTTKKLDDPVNVETKVSMIALPSFEQLDEVYFLSVQL